MFKRLGSGTGIMSPNASRRVWPVPPDAVSVSISQTPELLKVTFFGKNEELSSLDFRLFHAFEDRFDETFACVNQDNEARLRFVAEPDSGGAGFALAAFFEGGVTLAFLLKAEDGSLIVQWQKDLSKTSIWWRYQPLKAVQ